jgi:hypothetical protein
MVSELPHSRPARLGRDCFLVNNRRRCHGPERWPGHCRQPHDPKAAAACNHIRQRSRTQRHPQVNRGGDDADCSQRPNVSFACERLRVFRPRALALSLSQRCLLFVKARLTKTPETDPPTSHKSLRSEQHLTSSPAAFRLRVCGRVGPGAIPRYVSSLRSGSISGNAPRSLSWCGDDLAEDRELPAASDRRAPSTPRRVRLLPEHSSQWQFLARC